MQCPGQDSRFLEPKDVHEARCEACGRKVEMWPDEVARRCPGCGRRVPNPKIDLKCLAWCEHAEECLRQIRAAGGSVEDAVQFARAHRHEHEQEKAK